MVVELTCRCAYVLSSLECEFLADRSTKCILKCPASCLVPLFVDEPLPRSAGSAFENIIPELIEEIREGPLDESVD
jgi:hypothetical protein